MKYNITRIANIVAGNNPEGDLAVPLQSVTDKMIKLLTAKYAIEMSYRAFADRIRGPWRDALVNHWHEHAEDERKMSYDIAMKLVAFGVDPMITTVQIPACGFESIELARSLAAQELEAIKVGRELVAMAGTQTALKILFEDHTRLDNHHYDDLIRSFGHTVSL